MSPLTRTQQSIVDALDTSLVVTSGAGCGKTSVLVARYIRYLEQDLALGLERLAAITFTENAAAEMRQRIRQACRRAMAACQETGNTRQFNIWRDRYWDVDVASIDTIHAFCGGLLRRYAIEAGIDPQFALMDEAESALLRDDVVRRTVESLLDADDADLLTVLAHYDLGPARELLGDMLQEHREGLRRLAGPRMKESDEEILRGLKRRVDERNARVLRDLATSPAVARAAAVLAGDGGKPGDKAEDARRGMLAALESLRLARTPTLAAAAVEQLAVISLRGGSAKAWPPGDRLAEVREALKIIKAAAKDALAEVIAFDEVAERRHLLVARAFYRTAERIIAAYETAKAARSAFDFEDLQIRARDLLRDQPRVLEECRKRYRALLVDELQDTNLLQFEIINLLVSGPTERNQSPLRPGALFGVGDPKQSIYRFRGAEFEVFQNALDRVGAGGRRSLMASFRLHAGTAALVNHLFPPLMKDLYEPVEGQHEQKNAAVAEVLHVLSPDEKGFRSEEGHQEEARRLASRLKEIVDGRSVTVWDEAARTWRPARYGDVAILMRRMSHLHVYEQALEAQGVPYYVVAGRGFYQQQEVQDVLALLRVLDDPSDDLSLVAVLRSPFFSVSDEGLYHLRQLGAPLHDHIPAGAVAGHLDAEDRRGLRRAAKRLPEWSAQKDRRGMAALVDLVAFESGYAAGVVGKFGGERAYANLRQMVELARGFQERGLSSLGDYIAYVTDFMKNEMRAEQAPVESPGADSVRLMTIHKAKGLEFPIVVVPDLAYMPKGRHVSCLLSDATGIALRLRDEDGEGRTSAALALAVAEGAEAEQAEEHRLFYVALTRAKDYLLLSSHQAYNMVDGRQTWLNTSLDSLQAQVKPGTCEARLPTGHIVRLIFQTPDGQSAGRSARRGGPRDLFTSGRVAWDQLHERGQHGAGAAAEALAQIRPSAAPYQPPVRLAATSVAEYARCPAAYWWSHEFGVDEPEPQTASSGGLTPQAWGVAGHRVMELATSPAAEVTAAAVAGALREVEAAAADLPQLETRLRSAVDAFWASPLGRRVAGARRAYRELPFIVTVGAAEVRGTIDLVFQGADGRWELADYKSSGPSAEKAAAVAKPYELQLGLYALAAGRWLRTPVDRWSIWFLGSAATSEHSVAAADLARIEQAAQAALEGIASRRFDKPDIAACSSCKLRRLCETIRR